MRLFRMLPGVILTLTIVISVARAQQPETILLVRHADKASNDPDSLLSAAGHERAECLARTLQVAGIAAIYTTEVKRTQQTAEPLAQALHLEPKVVPKANTTELLNDLRRENGNVILVVGHADTLPGIVERLGAGKIRPFGEQEYDRLIVVPLTNGTAGQATAIRYCEPVSPAKPTQ